MTAREAKRIVLREFPGAYYDRESHAIRGYTHQLVLGQGSILARSIEGSAWIEAEREITRRGWKDEARAPKRKEDKNG